MNIEKLIKVVKLTKRTSVGDSPASDIVREIKAKYPDVKITQFSRLKKYPDGSTAHVAELEFSGYPGDKATGFSNDPRTGSRDNWEKFLKYLYQKYVPGADRFKASIAVGPHTLRIIDSMSVGDAGWFSNIYVKVSSPNEITAANMARVILKETKRPIKKITNAQVKDHTIRFQLLIQDSFSHEWIWMECPLTYQLSFDAMRKASKESEYGAEKLESAITKKLKSFEGKTIYENRSYADSIKTKDGWMNVRGTTRQGYEVRAIYNGKSGRLYAVIYRPQTKDFLVAAGYNQQRDDWDQGYYDYKSEEEARKFAEKHAKQMYDSVKDGNAEITEFMGNKHLIEKFKTTVKYNPRDEVRPILCEEPDFNPKLSEADLKEIARRLKIKY